MQNGAHCLVNWPMAIKPKELGGLGVPDRFGRALRLRWLWQDWTEDSKPWVAMDLPCNDADRLLFNSSTTINLGDGTKARFWHNKWLEGQAPGIWPLISSSLPEGKIDQCNRNYGTTIGYAP